MHDKLFDVFVSFYGEHLLDIILTHCSYPVIFTRFQLQSVEDADEFMIKVPVEKEAQYFQRLFHFSNSRDFANIFWHHHFRNKTFHQQFLKLLSEDQDCRDLCLSLSDTESSPLLLTAARGNNDITNVLLDIGMNVNVCDELDLTPLAYAAGGGCLETVKLLLEKNGDINKQHKHKHYVNFDLAIFQILSFFFTYLHRSHDLYHKQYELNKRFVKIIKGRQKNDEDSISWTYIGTPLYLSVAFGHTDIVKLLIQQNYDIGPHDLFPIPLLNIAALSNHIDIVKILLDHGCDINRCSDENESPLYVASKMGYVDIVKSLLDNKCEINICNKDRESPLHAASQCIGWVEFKYKLPNTFSKHFEELLRIFTMYMYSKKMKVSNGDYLEIVKLLLKHNADFNICNKDGKTPIELALENEHADIVKLLSEHSTVQMYKE